jgi:hypothetical protein
VDTYLARHSSRVGAPRMMQTIRQAVDLTNGQAPEAHPRIG